MKEDWFKLILIILFPFFSTQFFSLASRGGNVKFITRILSLPFIVAIRNNEINLRFSLVYSNIGEYKH